MKTLDLYEVQREAAFEAIGMIEALLDAGDLPEYARRDARRLVDKFMGKPAVQPEEEKQC